MCRGRDDLHFVNADRIVGYSQRRRGEHRRNVIVGLYVRRDSGGAGSRRERVLDVALEDLRGGGGKAGLWGARAEGGGRERAGEGLWGPGGVDGREAVKLGELRGFVANAGGVAYSGGGRTCGLLLFVAEAEKLGGCLHGVG